MKLVHWPLIGTAWRGLGRAAARPRPSSLYQISDIKLNNVPR